MDSDRTGVQSPLPNNFVNGVADYKGHPVLRSKSGRWCGGGGKICILWSRFQSDYVLDRTLGPVNGYGGREWPTVGIFILSYIQDNLSWGLGFGIPCVIMGFALMIFLFGTTTYRFGVKTKEKNAFARIGHVFVVAARNWRVTPSAISAEEEASGIRPRQGSQQFRLRPLA
ncbi:hypothetical protein L1987_22982 [Smallanthus sonchifolius]|uniref:Uncharacterized protein n=1 Tax=Smallanthus sonchifolius TaxID=185202 RepID=A0ACB9IGX5_9ASTR|nr:hypothetical protein L1987_22982 [Smallanthus sonchifolius]